MLSWISSDFFARSPLLVYPLVSLGIFMAVFVAASLRVFLTRREDYDAVARLPLDESEVQNHG